MKQGAITIFNECGTRTHCKKPFHRNYLIAITQEDKKGSQVSVYKIKHTVPMMDLRKTPKCLGTECSPV